MSGRLQDKVTLVTGIGGGIGRAAALLFATEGAVVVGCDLQEAGTAETVEILAAQGHAIDATTGLDLGDPDATRAWVDRAADRHGGIDVLFNNASAIRFGAIDELSVEDWSFTVRNELDLVFHAIRAAWPHLRARGGGSVVNVGSISGTRGAWFQPQNAHGATKGGVLGLTAQLAVEGGSDGIRVNAVSPALTRTPATEHLFTDPDSPFDFAAARIPLGRAGEPLDIARAALFLASDEASYITGVNLPVDGGTAAVG